MRERNILITVEYDGTNFCGWQRQPNVRTVQGVLEDALSRICQMPIQLDGVSRTDAGVHALGQRATFHGTFGIPTERIPIAINDLVSEAMKDGDLRIVKAEEVPMEFHARFDSKGKKYRYCIWNQAEMPVFLRNYRYHVRKPLDVAAMQAAADRICGTHDFACFQAAGGTPRKTTVRTVHSLTVSAGAEGEQTTGAAAVPGAGEAAAQAPTPGAAAIPGTGEPTPQAAMTAPEQGAGDIAIEIAGDGFLYNMVRIITGTLVEVGLGKIAPEEIDRIIEGKDRRAAGHTAPAQGLFLVEVYYG